MGEIWNRPLHSRYQDENFRPPSYDNLGRPIRIWRPIPEEQGNLYNANHQQQSNSAGIQRPERGVTPCPRISENIEIPQQNSFRLPPPRRELSPQPMMSESFESPQQSAFRLPPLRRELSPQPRMSESFESPQQSCAGIQRPERGVTPRPRISENIEIPQQNYFQTPHSHRDISPVPRSFEHFQMPQRNYFQLTPQELYSSTSAWPEPAWRHPAPGPSFESPQWLLPPPLHNAPFNSQHSLPGPSFYYAPPLGGYMPLPDAIYERMVEFVLQPVPVIPPPAASDIGHPEAQLSNDVLIRPQRSNVLSDVRELRSVRTRRATNRSSLPTSRHLATPSRLHRTSRSHHVYDRSHRLPREDLLPRHDQRSSVPTPNPAENSLNVLDEANFVYTINIDD